VQKKLKPYIRQTTPELFSSETKDILDLGPGPGHYTFLLRSLGHNTKGIDRKIDSETMKCYEYLNKKYKLGHMYWGVENVIEKDNFGFNNKFDVINFRGSFWHILKTIEDKNSKLIESFFTNLAHSLKNNNSKIILSLNKRPIEKSLKYLDSQGVITLVKIDDNTFIGKAK